MAQFKVEFTVKSVIKRNDLYASIIATKINCDNVRLKKEIRKQMEIRGDFPISLCQDDRFSATVEKKIDKLNSTTYLEVQSNLLRIGLEKTETLAKFLRQRIIEGEKENDKLKNWKLPLTTCTKIVNILGLDTINKIIQNPLELLDYPELKLNEDKVLEIQNILMKCVKLQQIAFIIQSSNLKLHTALSLYELYGNETLSVIRDNPYQICYNDKISFKIADKLAYDLKFDINNEIRIRTGIISFLKYKRDCGNICILKEQLYNNFTVGDCTLNQYLNRFGAYKNNNISEDNINKEIKYLIKENRIIYEKDAKTEYLYLPEMYSIENQLVDKIKNLLDNYYNQKFCDQSDIDDFLQAYEKKTKFNLDILQKKAVEKTLQNKLFILTGGPGTGKTATVSVIVQAIKSISKTKYNKKADIILLAPTGKAAERMTELTNELSSTIHRGLNLSYQNNIPEELDADFVIVDESSMIDVFLMFNLLKSLSDRTRILFVGDVNQLPSVGPGKMLYEFMSSNKIPYVMLKTIFRQAQNSMIVNNANKIISGLTSNDPNGIILTNEDNNNFKFIQEQNTEGIKNKIISKVDEYLSKGIKLSEISILTAMRKGDIGVETLNTLLQETYNHNTTIFENKEFGITFKEGDKVIQTQNNYELKVFNGYIGIIKEIDNTNVVNGYLKPKIIVEYDNLDAPVEYIGENIYQLDLAYVLTIHKSQGSEYPYVITPIHMEQNVLLNRNLLYTAVTRARQEYCLIGDEKAVNKTIKTEMSEYERISRLAYKIATI